MTYSGSSFLILISLSNCHVASWNLAMSSSGWHGHPGGSTRILSLGAENHCAASSLYCSNMSNRSFLLFKTHLSSSLFDMMSKIFLPLFSSLFPSLNKGFLQI